MNALSLESPMLSQGRGCTTKDMRLQPVCKVQETFEMQSTKSEIYARLKVTNTTCITRTHVACATLKVTGLGLKMVERCEDICLLSNGLELQ